MSCNPASEGIRSQHWENYCDAALLSFAQRVGDAGFVVAPGICQIQAGVRDSPLLSSRRCKRVRRSCESGSFLVAALAAFGGDEFALPHIETLSGS